MMADGGAGEAKPYIINGEAYVYSCGKSQAEFSYRKFCLTFTNAVLSHLRGQERIQRHINNHLRILRQREDRVCQRDGRRHQAVHLRYKQKRRRILNDNRFRFYRDELYL